MERSTPRHGSASPLPNKFPTIGETLRKGGSRVKAFEEQSDEKAGGDGSEMRREAASAAKNTPHLEKKIPNSSSRPCGKPPEANTSIRDKTAPKTYKYHYVKLLTTSRFYTRFSPVGILWKNLCTNVEKITLDILTPF